MDRRSLQRAVAELTVRPAPPLPSRLAAAQLIRVLFVPEVAGRSDAYVRDLKDSMLVTAGDLFS